VPQFFDGGVFGKEPMATDVEPISVVCHGARQTSDDVVFFQNNARKAEPTQFVGRGQTGRPSADDDRALPRGFRVMICDPHYEDRGVGLFLINATVLYVHAMAAPITAPTNAP